MTSKKNSLAVKANKFTRYLPLYLMMLPALFYLLINNYMPMAGIVLAFKKYTVQGGIWGSEWNGLKNFAFLARSKDVPIIIRNTLGYNFCFILTNVILGVTLAIFITEIGNKKLQKYAQSSILFPFVVSIIIVSYMVRAFLDPQAGLVNSLLESLPEDILVRYLKTLARYPDFRQCLERRGLQLHPVYFHNFGDRSFVV